MPAVFFRPDGPTFQRAVFVTGRTLEPMHMWPAPSSAAAAAALLILVGCAAGPTPARLGSGPGRVGGRDGRR